MLSRASQKPGLFENVQTRDATKVKWKQLKTQVKIVFPLYIFLSTVIMWDYKIFIICVDVCVCARTHAHAIISLWVNYSSYFHTVFKYLQRVWLRFLISTQLPLVFTESFFFRLTKSEESQAINIHQLERSECSQFIRSFLLQFHVFKATNVFDFKQSLA